jgi:hypothetical protein
VPPAIDTRPAPRWLLLIAGGWGVNEQGAVLAAVAPLSALICALPAVPRAADPQRACPRAAGRKLLGASTRRPRAASQPTLTPSRCPLAAGCRGSCSSMWMVPSSGGLQPAGRGCCCGSWVPRFLQLYVDGAIIRWAAAGGEGVLLWQLGELLPAAIIRWAAAGGRALPQPGTSPRTLSRHLIQAPPRSFMYASAASCTAGGTRPRCVPCAPSGACCWCGSWSSCCCAPTTERRWWTHSQVRGQLLGSWFPWAGRGPQKGCISGAGLALEDAISCGCMQGALLQGGLAVVLSPSLLSRPPTLGKFSGCPLRGHPLY